MKDDMGEVRLDVVLDSIDHGSSQTEREKGLTKLKECFERSQRGSNIEMLSDKSYHRIFEILFKTVLGEKTSYLSSNKKGKPATLKRLTACGDGLRLVIGRGLPKLKARTIEAVVGHITQTLPKASGGFLEPLLQNYLKSLSTIFEREANVERLKSEVWIDTADFCLQAINHYLECNEGEAGLSRSFSGLGTFQSSRAQSVLSNAPNESRTCTLSRQNLEEVFQVLLFLVTCPNAPVLERYSVVADCAVRFLQLQGTVTGQTHLIALSVINAVLRVTCEQLVAFTQSVAVKALSIISRFWQTKTSSKDELSNSIREESMILLFLAHPHLERAVHDGNNPELSGKLEDLVDVLRTDYSRRSDRDPQLQIDDLEMSGFGPTAPTPFRLNAFQLRSHNIKAEREWASLQIIGILERLLSLGCKVPATGEEDEEMELHPSKRQRTSQASDRLLEPLQSDDEKVRLCGLQSLPFILQNMELSSSALSSLLRQLYLCVGDKRGSIGSWALLGIASCTFQKAGGTVEVPERMQLWRAGMRSLTFSSTCRSAALALHALLAKNVVSYKEVGEDVEVIISAADTNGPTILCDSSIFLMAHLLHTRVTEAPGASLSASQNTIRWFFSRWNPVDREFAVNYATHVQPYHILLLLRTSLGLPQLPISPSVTSRGSLAQAWQYHLSTREVINYLLLLERPKNEVLAWKCLSCPKPSKFSDIIHITTTSHFQAARNLLLEQIRPKCAKALQDWKTYLAGRSSPVSVDLYRSALHSCIAMLSLTAYFSDISSELFQTLKTELLEFSRELVGFHGDIEARDPATVQALNVTLLQCIKPVLPPCGIDNFREFLSKQVPLVEFLVLVAEHLKRHRSQSSDTSSAHDEDSMDLDDEFTPRQTQQKSKGHSTNMPRQNRALDMWSGSYELAATGKLELIAAIKLTPDIVGFVPTTFVDYTLSLTDEEFLASRQIILEALLSDLAVNEADACRLVEKLGEILASDDLDRCEVTLSVCCDVLAALEHMWSGGAVNHATDVADSASQIYQWLITRALGKGIASPDAQKDMAKLLFVLLRANTEYGVDIKLPSPRTSLFDILKTSVASVKFYIGSQIHHVFEKYILKDHEAVFVDIMDNLPEDAAWLEGASFRLYVFAILGSKWPTLLRRCIYHIFEIPPHIPESLQHATRCLEDISSKLQVTDARELFGLFAPQLLFTWLDPESEITRTITEIPFQIFGFGSLRDLVLHVKEEATALMVMRGQDTKPIADILGLKDTELLRDSFTKAIAYSTAHDMGTPPTSSAKKNGTGESRVKACLGRELFAECLYNHFTDIIAAFFINLDQDTSFEKSLKKKEEYIYAAKIVEQIKSLSSSNKTLPPNQQPTFKAKFLTSQIQHLTRKTEYEVPELYTPALVTSVVRKLLNTIHPALGSLHACSVIRKIRVFISLAGQSVLTGYPLEMLLQSIRPFLKDAHCSEDTIGILQYLLDSGNFYLVQVPSFVAGVSLSILGSLESFKDSKKASTTQESEHNLAKSKAEDFQKWMTTHLAKYNSPAAGFSKNRFQRLMDAALHAPYVGGVDEGTSESVLLHHLLNDEKSGGNLLSRPSRELALSMLSSNFAIPNSFRTDFLGSDALSVEYASVVWKSCRGSTNKQYQCWAARVLGRAFAASGYVHEELLQESSLSRIKNLTLGRDGNSVVSVLCLLRELTLGNNLRTLGIVETALRFMIANSDELLAPIFESTLPESLLVASSWAPYNLPPSDTEVLNADTTLLLQLQAQEAILAENWLRDFSLAIALSVPNDPVLAALVLVLSKVPGFAEQAFPFVVHLVLSSPYEGPRISKRDLSSAFMTWIGNPHPETKNNLKMIINAIIYLRTQPIIGEKTPSERSHWLEIDFVEASKAATFCGMFKTALLFFEDFYSQPVKSTRRSSAIKDTTEQNEFSNDALLEIYENIDDPDLYYGVQQHSNLNTILARFEYEKDGPKSLAFRGAQYDNHVRRGDLQAAKDVQSLVKALDILDLSGLSHSLLQGQQAVGMTPTAIESMFRTARKLEQWDIPVPSTYSNNAVATYRAFQAVHSAVDRHTILQAVNEGFGYTMSNLLKGEMGANMLHESLQTLAALVEMDEVFGSCGSEQFEEVLTRFRSRSGWMKVGRFDDVSQIISCRGTTMSTLSQRPRLQEIVQVKSLDSRLVEVHTALLAAGINRSHNVLQESLSLATSMIDLIKPCHEVGINPEVAIHLEAANALWDQGEMLSSIGMLQALDNPSMLKKQTIPVGRSDLLSKIGHQVSVARLEKPDRIIDKYLRPALKELKSRTTGSETGQVFLQFAVFCDQQLQDPDSLEDIERLKRLSKNKAAEVKYYDKLIAKAKSTTEANRLRNAQAKAKTWVKLDEEELKRHKENREMFLKQCLENYLLALAASDDHNSIALRFSALWLEHSEYKIANEAVSNKLARVPSRKFAPLMNQLTSRLQDIDTEFQQQLCQLVLRICTDHPYHGMYQIYTSYKTAAKAQDEAAISRKNAATKVVNALSTSSETQVIWNAIYHTSNAYVLLAVEKDDVKYKSGRKVNIKESRAAMNLVATLHKYKIAPPSMRISISPDCNYFKVPTVATVESEITIASGVSAPKIIVTRTERGVRFKQLVKGGNDDLRQDAIMEQVFEQVSELLKINRSTQQRNLSIRTYKVLPLTTTAGIIEFVADTQPLHDYLMPAHERHYPKDLKGSQCRKQIGDAQNMSIEARLKTFRSVTDRFRPVMHFFFTEKYVDPDEWFIRRLAYTRSTAAISILGHVLGLGDRHGHNILLDTKSGEVVHIDLGVAFEMGRILPVPELIPFRLTRDIVDGFGITKTEGVFRRCCEFTLEALRKEVDTIMSVLDVLRHDPLHQWSISPVRLAKLQEEQNAVPEVPKAEEGAMAPQPPVKPRDKNEPSEADRALTVVNKKLSKTLSVTATVNDLINQASDERNLAVLYSGWAAYA